MDPKVETKRSYGLMLFGLPFFLVGAGFLLWSVIPSLYDGWRMQSWLSTSGTLTHAELVASHSDGSTTYRAEARYRYNVSGRQFRHDRVAISNGGDNIGSFNEKLGLQLETQHRGNQPVVVYYNPDDPADAVLNREIRWGLLGFKSTFILVFGGVGAGLIFWGFRGKRTIASKEAIDKPWLARPQWRNGVIRSGAKGGMYAIWGFAVLWNLISAPAAFQVVGIWHKEGPIALLILLFPVVGMGLLYWAIKLTREWRRFGVTQLTLDPFPGSIDGDVGGKVQVNTPFKGGMLCRVTLSHIYSYTSGSGKNRSRKEEVKWQDDGYARIVPEGRGVELQFRFEVPTGLRESEEASRRYYFWRLNVELEMEGVDLDRSFEIPVFNTGGSSRYITFNSSTEQPSGVPRITAESLLPMTRTGHRKIIHYRALRKPGRSLGLLILGGIFAGAGIFLWGEAAKEGGMLYFMAGIFGLVGWSVVIGAIYSAFNSLHVSLDGRYIVSTRSFLGLPVNRKTGRYSNVLEIVAKEGMKSSSGHKHRIEYSVVAKLSGKNITLAEHLDSASKKNLVIKYFENELSP
ncbi:MAG: DUF3592 domain-containing protein [Halieaceae bacterium]|nr:DUF3592 domain-containing protein [Halieaceae bacterium]